MVHGLVSPAVGTAPAATGKRISASSFKLLTAKLKKAPLPDLPAFQPVVETAPPPATLIEEPPAANILPEIPVEAAGLEPAAEIAEPEPAVEEPPQLELPQFQPIDFYVPKIEATFADEPQAEVELPLRFEPRSDRSEEAALAPLPDFILAPIDFVAPAAEGLEKSNFEIQTEPAFEAAASTAAEEAAELLLEEVHVATEQQQEPVAPELEFQALEQDPAPEQLSPAVDEALSEPQAAVPASGEEEPKTLKSELAGRVVDAMLKTISTAVYAKPSAAERAAFLREMAEIMEQEAAAAGELAPAPSAVVAAPRQPDAVQSVGIQAVAAQAAAVPPPTIQPSAVKAVEEAPIADALAIRIGPAATLLKPKAEQEADPFAQNLGLSLLIDPVPEETAEADEEAGELAITLLDMMSGGQGTALPHERTLAADTLLRILPRIPVKQLLAVVERVAIMETPPALLVAKLIRDPRHEVVGPLLERCSHISDQDLMNAAPDGDAPKLRMIARRRVLSTVLSDYLISIGETGVLLTLIRNPGAALSHDAFFKLAEIATRHHGLLAPLATRADLPPPVAFELFWHVPQELRRFIFSRFLTDSETLNKILRITLATHADASNDVVGEGKFPTREAIEEAVEHAAKFRLEEAARQFSEIGSIARDTAMRILSDREGEPITVLFKALGYPRSKFEEALGRLRHSDSGVLRPDRNPEEMQAIFDSLSFNKARILLTYWDWFVRKAGPYSPHN